MRWEDHIEQKPGVMMGKPVIKGTRLTVEHIVERLGAGWTEAELMESYPDLTRDEIHAALTFAAKSLSSEMTVYLADAVR
ncbi:MAG TPA: DUF433 domain-containing protein [Phycisphaerae bacterium]|nr:DUF433 domain-containing protein [Phycisphaerae bacterium]